MSSWQLCQSPECLVTTNEHEFTWSGQLLMHINLGCKVQLNRHVNWRQVVIKFRQLDDVVSLLVSGIILRFTVIFLALNLR